MSNVVSDSMTGTDWSNLASHVGALGASWTRHEDTPSTQWYIFDNKVHCGVAGLMYASGIPANADVTLECDYTMYTDIGHVGLAVRVNTTQLTFYYCYYLANELVLAKQVNGVITSLGADVTGLIDPGDTVRLSLSAIGSTIAVAVDGVTKISVSDSDITSAGRFAVRSASSNDAGTGKHIDNLLGFDSTATVIVRQHFVGIIG